MIRCSSAVRFALVGCLALAALDRAAAASHTLEATKDTVHWGYYSKTLAPVLEIASGDDVYVEMVSHHSGDDPELMINGDTNLEEIFAWGPTGPGTTHEAAMRGATGSGDGVHVLTGPIRVNGAMPGDILKVEVLELTPRKNPNGRAYGVNAAAWWGFHYGTNGLKSLLGDLLGLKTGNTAREITTVYEAIYDGGNVKWAEPVYQARYGQNQAVVTDCLSDSRTGFSPGVTVPCVNGKQTWTGYYFPGLLTDTSKVNKDTSIAGKFKVPANLHVGSMGLAPPAPDFVDSVPPMPYGGNLDNRRINVGSTMHYPVGVEGAMISMGDAHLAQGDGELDGTAIEMSINGRFRISVVKPGDAGYIQNLDFPILENDNDWCIHGFTYQNYLTELGYDTGSPSQSIYSLSNTDRALANAMRNAKTFLSQVAGLSEDEALTLLSTAGDFGITQIVDGNWGAHVLIPKWAISGSSSPYTRSAASSLLPSAVFLLVPMLLAVRRLL